MSNGIDHNTNFGKQDGVDLKTYFCDRIEALLSLINEKDKNYDQRFSNVTSATKSALEASDRAITKAELASEKRFDAVNEFRSTLADQQRTLMPRTECEIMFRNLGERIEKLAQSDVMRAGQKSGFAEGWGFAAGAVGIIIAILAVISRFI